MTGEATILVTSSGTRPVGFPCGTDARWLVRRHEDGGEIVRIKQVTAKFRESHRGWSHVYMSGVGRVAAIMVSGFPRKTIRSIEVRLGRSVSIDQLGDNEFVISTEVEYLDGFCRAVRAQKKFKQSAKHLAAAKRNLAGVLR